MYRQDLEYYINHFKMDLQEAVFDKEAFREELMTQKLKVAKLEEQNLEKPEIRQELDHGSCQGCLKPRHSERNSVILKDVTRDFASTEMIWQKNLRRTSMIGRSHRRHEQDLKSLATLKIY